MEAGLSRGAVAAISAHGGQPAGLRPVLQVADVRPVAGRPGRGGVAAQRYRLLLSDGVHTAPGMLALASELGHLAADGALRRGTVLRLLECVVSTIQSRRIFMVIQLEIVQTDCAMIGNPTLYVHRQDVPFAPAALRPAEKVPANSYAMNCDELPSYGQGMVAALSRKTIAQINDENMRCSDKQRLVIVKAILSFINAENFCYTACPLVVDGRQCSMMVATNGDGYMILV
ncbi:hypothetical protein ACP4OV_016601 [Aristida adscensionis]